jgi:predicted restriction endonuclease
MDQKFCCRVCKDKSQEGIEPPRLAANRGVKPRTYHLRHRDKHGSAEDREWRTAVFERDHYTCRDCGQAGGRLQAHHIEAFKARPDLRHELSNGLTLCIICHKKTDTYGWQNYWKHDIAVKRLSQEVFDFEVKA